MPQVLSTTVDLTTDNSPWWESPKAKLPINLPDDPVTLGVASYNIWKKNNGARWSDFGMIEVTQEDREEAVGLRKYYRDRLIIDALKSNGSIVSAFRQKLQQLINNELVITDSELGMLYRLPYFYEEDRALDRIISKTVTVSPSSAYQGRDYTATYTLLERVLRSRRSGEFYDYWMTTDQDPYLHLLVVKNDNPLRSLVEDIISQPVKMNTRVWTKQHRGHHRNREYQQIMIQGLSNDR